MDDHRTKCGEGRGARRATGRRTTWAVVLLWAAMAGCSGPGAREQEPMAGSGGTPEDLTALVTARLDSLDAESALYARHLPTGREILVRPDRVMNTLSVIKLTAMVRAYQRVEAGLLDLDERVPLEAADMRGGSGLLQTFQPGLEPTWRDVITQMIITSDNTATDMVLDEIPPADVNHMLDSLGFDATRFRMSTGELFAELDRRLQQAGVGGGDAGATEDIVFEFEGDSTVWLGRSTPRETARLLTGIREGRWTSQDHGDEMMEILGRQFYSSRLPRTLRGDVQVAHKTGDWPPHAGNDVGVIFYDGGPLVVAVYVNQNRGDFLRVERTMGRIAEDLVEAWGPEGS